MRVTSLRMRRLAIPDTTAARSVRVRITVSRGDARRLRRSLPAFFARFLQTTVPGTRPGVVDLGGV